MRFSASCFLACPRQPPAGLALWFACLLSCCRPLLLVAQAYQDFMSLVYQVAFGHFLCPYLFPGSGDVGTRWSFHVWSSLHVSCITVELTSCQMVHVSFGLMVWPCVPDCPGRERERTEVETRQVVCIELTGRLFTTNVSMFLLCGAPSATPSTTSAKLQQKTVLASIGQESL